jgi:two-component system chemotaxis response regulator CheY
MSTGQLKITDIVVLLVEPSSTQQKIISRQFSEIGISNLLFEKDGSSALQSMKRDKPDVVISALYLPDMTGTDLVYRMKENPETQDTGFILISSETRFRYLDPVRQAGAIAILPKPFSSEDLRIAMNNTLDFIDPDSLHLGQSNVEDLTVLVVDDSQFARNHIMRTLKSMGIENFHQAADGIEALEQMTKHYFDFIVTDYNMPNMDGQELVEFIRQKSCQSSIPVLMVTSENNENRLAAVQQSGVSAICDKPFESQTVRSIVQQMLSS